MIRKKGFSYSRGKGGMVLGGVLAALTIIVSIIVNLSVESKTGGLISGIIGFRSAPFIVCILCAVYQLWFVPKIDGNFDRDTSSLNKLSDKMISVVGFAENVVPEIMIMQDIVLLAVNLKKKRKKITLTIGFALSVMHKIQETQDFAQLVVRKRNKYK